MASSLNVSEFNNSDGCAWFSCPERPFVPAVYVLLCISAVAVVLLTVFGNLLVIVSICYFKRLHTPTNMLLLSLAVSDFLVGFLIMPFQFAWLIESCWRFGRLFCILFNFVSFQLTSVSVGNVALIALDRYVALSNPFLYSRDSSPATVRAVVLVSWLFSLLYNFFMFYLSGNFTHLTMCPGECLYLLSRVASLVDLIFIVVVPCSLMVVLYSQVFVIARKHANAIRELSKGNSDCAKSESKAAKALGVLVLVFLACLVPYYVCSLTSKEIGTDSSNLLTNSVLILFYLNSSVNPLIYALFYSWFQKCIKMILSCKILCTDCSFVNVLEMSN